MALADAGAEVELGAGVAAAQHYYREAAPSGMPIGTVAPPAVSASPQ